MFNINIMNKLFLFAALSVPGVALAQNADPIVNAPDNGSVALSVAQGSALIVDTRPVTLPAGRARLRFGNIAPTRVENGLQISLPNGRVLSQNSLGADTDYLALLQKSIGQRVTLRYYDAPPVTGTLRQVRPFIMLETADGVHIERSASPFISIERLPADALARASVEALAESNGGGGNAELRYVATGLGWSASYRATLLGDRLSLGAWATLANDTTADFRNARVNLVTATTQGEPVFAFPDVLDLPPGSKRELLLASFDKAAFTQDIVWFTDTFGSSVTGKPRLTLSLKGGAPAALPAGALTVYGAGQSGAPMILSGGTLGPFSKGEDIRLALGEVPFVTVSRGIASQRRLNPKTNEFNIAISLANSGTSPVTVRVVEPIPADAKITQGSQPPSKSQSSNLEFLVTVPAKDNATLTYTVERPV